MQESPDSLAFPHHHQILQHTTILLNTNEISYLRIGITDLIIIIYLSTHDFVSIVAMHVQ